MVNCLHRLPHFRHQIRFPSLRMVDRGIYALLHRRRARGSGIGFNPDL